MCRHHVHPDHPGLVLSDQVNEVSVEIHSVADHPVDLLEVGDTLQPLEAPGLSQFQQAYKSLVLAEVYHTWWEGKGKQGGRGREGKKEREREVGERKKERKRERGRERQVESERKKKKRKRENERRGWETKRRAERKKERKRERGRERQIESERKRKKNKKERK